MKTVVMLPNIFIAAPSLSLADIKLGPFPRSYSTVLAYKFVTSKRSRII